MPKLHIWQTLDTRHASYAGHRHPPMILPGTPVLYLGGGWRGASGGVLVLHHPLLTGHNVLSTAGVLRLLAAVVELLVLLHHPSLGEVEL